MVIVDPCVDVELVPEGSKPKIINGPKKEYLDLPTIVTPRGHVITRWRPTAEERERLIAGDDVFLTIWVGDGHSINPVFLSVGPCDWKKM